MSDLLDEEDASNDDDDGHGDGGDRNDDDDGGGRGGVTGRMEQPHACAVSVVLGEASILIQPLSAWRGSIVGVEDDPTAVRLR